MKKPMMIMLLGFLFITGDILLAQPSPGRGVDIMARLVKQLKLTDDQVKEVEKIRFDHMKQTIAQQSKIATARVELQQLFTADNLDKPSIEKKIKEIADLEAQKGILKVNNWFAVNKLLTPEQQKLWKKGLVDHRANRMETMQRRMNMPQRQRQNLPPQKQSVE